MDKTHNLRHLLNELIRTHNLEPKMLEQQVFVLWRKHVSAPLATNTVPVSLSNGILKIYTAYPAYKTSLLFDKPKILADINAKLGKPVLTDLRIEIHEVLTVKSHETEDGSPSPETPREDSIIDDTHQEVTPEQLEKIEQVLASVPDTQVKKSLWQLFTTQIKDKP